LGDYDITRSGRLMIDMWRFLVKYYLFLALIVIGIGTVIVSKNRDTSFLFLYIGMSVFVAVVTTILLKDWLKKQ
jgi:hypothetical protein